MPPRRTRRSFRPAALVLRFAPLLVVIGLVAAPGARAADEPVAAPPRVKKIRDLVLYENPRFYCAFPSIVTRPDGELLVAFRRAPDRRAFGEGGSSHTDPNSYLVSIRSTDHGASWSPEPSLILAHPFGGSQDPCLNQLRDGTIVCSSYGWALLAPEAAAKAPPTLRHGDFVFMGGYLMRSDDGGRHWEGPIVPPPVPGDAAHDVFGASCPAYNRGAMVEARDGRLLWATATQARLDPRRTEVHLMSSTDRGSSWEYVGPVARDEKATFNETSLYETPAGAIVAFLRTANFDDHTCIARASDGRTFEPFEDAGFQGHPHFAQRLPGGDEALLIYGYRHAPFGIRARVLDAECTNAATAEEIVLRDDGDGGDIGYPWATLAADGRVLVVYYFSGPGGLRRIEGTLLEIERDGS